MKFIKRLTILGSSLAMLAACSSTPTVPLAAKTAPTTPVVAAPAAPVVAITSKVQSVVLPAYLDPTNALATTRSVYFDYDNFSVKPEFNRMLELHGKFLAANAKVSIRVEGNADERGSAEYNLALGQKRADTVVRALKVYGVKDAQMEAVSWGKEKPKAMGHDEAAFEQNRRVDLGYPTK